MAAPAAKSKSREEVTQGIASRGGEDGGGRRQGRTGGSRGQVLLLLPAPVPLPTPQERHLHWVHGEPAAVYPGQHNGKNARSGAARGEPSAATLGDGLCIYGFPTNVAALQFESAWQHPTVSVAVRNAAASFKSLGGVNNKVMLAYTMRPCSTSPLGESPHKRRTSPSPDRHRGHHGRRSCLPINQIVFKDFDVGGGCLMLTKINYNEWSMVMKIKMQT
ncbi:hypothetical protein GUJ93_ZPchr0013g35783 [Zizania palustris]|uniref:Uncharacterized protein n=1 Tax=Zizania palustris TaxID=103762 RepID=A0A8J5X4Y1_ZIZPA|nr:hypothetical protein GUJ93_ZPchr0013g35783 [Zizania palustris]